ncbi:MAG: NADH-ubiquinone oxidoreductase-F iron-sulfur binding region domain-containing protein [Phycisphaerae bacterium]|jgi:NADH-quinone oxidoreductase subunit F
MQKTENNEKKIGAYQCWPDALRPSKELIAELKSGPFGAALAKGQQVFDDMVDTLRRDKLAKPAVFVGAGTCGMGAGAGKTLDAIREYCKTKKLDVDIVEVGCIGFCSEEPIVDIKLPGKARVSFGNVVAENVSKLLDDARVGKFDPDHLLGQFRSDSGQAWKGVQYLDEHPFMKLQRRVVLAGSGIIDPTNIDEYIARGGYSAMAWALKNKTAQELCDLVESSGLRGRGGGGFPTGKKWKFALNQAADQKYLVCNADEGDPGAFMDRAVGESDPHRLIEGMIIAAYGIGATKAYIYIRAEYPLAVQRLTDAIKQARAYGLLGHNILDSGNDLDITIKMGAGAFVCGEETALMHSIEGKRGMPRPRPPFPAIKGLFGKPTVINNVETLANLPMIIERGADWFSAMGTKTSKGTKVFALSGMVKRTGLVEVPMGTTIKQVVYDVGGGIPNRKRGKGVQIGGPSGGCIPDHKLDIEIDYETIKTVGAIMGSGGLVVLDESTCMVDLAKFFMEFIQSESCGKCIPCREGTKRMLEILEAITRPRRKEDNTDALMRFQGVMQLRQLAETIKSTSLCGLGQTAPNPVLSTLNWFRDEYEAHIFDRQCPAGACRELVGAPCQNSCPVGTEVWRYVAHISRNEYDDAYRIIRQANPLPSICARVCHHPCESACRAGVTGGEPIAVRSLKRFVVERVNPSIWKESIKPTDSGSAKIAIIGAGPTGLAAANALAVAGHKVTIFEREAKAGGMLVGAIPAYRLPRELLQKEIDALLNPNIEIKYNVALGRDINIDGLLAEGYKAIFLAMGSHQSLKLKLPDENVEGIIPGIQFLKAYNLQEKALAKGRVGIIGGGNSAMDAARVAFRQKGIQGVTMFYRRTRNEMPAYAEEIEAGLDEGIRIEELVAPVAVLSKNGKLTGMRFIRNELGQPDAGGRRSPVPIPGSEFEVALDTLIVAISEQPDTQGIQNLNLTKWGTLSINEQTMVTSQKGVFAAGDVVTGPATVIAALAAGKKAAVMIDRYVRGRIMKVLPKLRLPSVYIEPVQTDEEETTEIKRVMSPHLPAECRCGNFKEVELSISEEQALCEARRCLRCDLEFTQP